jgi:hypothetical protein
LKQTLEKFIDPVNIPIKYGGQLKFEFGDFPVLDPAIKEVITWENGVTDFPQGPKLWVHSNGDAEKTMKAIAVGSVEEKQRRQEVCVVKKLLDETADPTLLNGVESSPLPVPVLPDELLDVPTATATPASQSATDLLRDEHVKEKPSEDTFVSATESLTLGKKSVESTRVGAVTGQEVKEGEKAVVANGSPAGPHTTAAANLLDPAVDAKVAEKEGALVPAEAGVRTGTA